MKLYYHPLSTYSQKVLIALYEKGIDFTPEIINLMDPDAHNEYRKTYPMGKVPCLELDDGHIIPESSIIVEYIDSMDEPMLLKGDAEKIRKIRFKDRMYDLYLIETVATLLFQGLKPESEQDPERIEKARSQIDTMYGFMENELGNQAYSNGDEFLMSDCAAAPGLFYAQHVAPFAEHENICAYWERLIERSSIQRTQEEATPYLEAFMNKNAA